MNDKQVQEIEVEVIEEIVIVDIAVLEESYGTFAKEVEESTAAIAININMDELSEIGDEIIKARTYLTSFASGAKKSTREKLYGQVGSVPLIGNWAKGKVEEIQLQHAKDSGVKEVLNDMFNNFDIKKKRLVELTSLAHNIEAGLISQEVELVTHLRDIENLLATTQDPSVKMRALDLSIQAQSSEKIIKDQIHNKLHFIVDMMETLHLRMSKTIPSLKAQLLNETSIAGMITSIADSVKMMDSLQDLTNDIAKISTANIQGLIINVTESMTSGIDVEFYKESAATNAKFQKTMIECKAKQIKATVKSYEELQTMGIDTSNQLAHRAHSEKVALGMTTERWKDQAEEVLDADLQ